MTHGPSTTKHELVLRDDRGPVTVLTLNRPERRNALSHALVAALGDVLGKIGVETGVRAVVITGAGSTFCAGMDLKEVAELLALPQNEASQRAVADMQAFADLIDQVHKFPRPVIAAVQGNALAGGAGLALACDLVVMADTALLGYPEVKRGLVPTIVMHDLVRQVGDRRARRLLLTGEAVDSASALQWGMVNAVTPPDECLERAVELAGRFAACAPQALATTKHQLDEASGRARNLRGAAAVSAAQRETDEAREGIGAFLEKRPPRWEITPNRLPSYGR
jgi:methylglutaconyl-CoA hydratase